MFWDPLEFILAVTLIGFGLALNLFVVGVAASIGVLYGSRALKRGSKKGAAQHYIWALGLNIDKFLADNFMPAEKNDFIE